jgi:hypothetical protein
MAIVRNLVVDKYSNFEKIVALYDKNKEPFNLTNYTASSQIRKFTDLSIVTSFTCDIVQPANTGKILISLSYSDTANANPGIYSYDVLLSSTIDPNEKLRAVQGEVEITANITE